MPREVYAVTTKTLNLDAQAVADATALIPGVQATYLAYELAEYGSNLPEDVTIDYVYTVAVGVGLNRLTDEVNYPVSVGQYLQQSGTGVAAVGVDVIDEDLVRADTLAQVYSVPIEDVLSAAVCTGIHLMSGGDPLTVRGPFAL